MKLKNKYTFEDIDKLEEEISRIIYMWRRYEGTKIPEGKQFKKYEVIDLLERIRKYTNRPEKFNFNEGKVITEIDEKLSKK